MKSKDKNEGCFNCKFCDGIDNFSMRLVGIIKCNKTDKNHVGDYSCKKWKMYI